MGNKMKYQFLGVHFQNLYHIDLYEQSAPVTIKQYINIYISFFKYTRTVSMVQTLLFRL